MEIKKELYRSLGKTEIRVSPLAIGTWQFSRSKNFPDADEVRANRIIRVAIDRGVNFFDTAEGYGDGESERILGNALKQSGNEVVVISKIMTYGLNNEDFRLTEKMISESIEASLRRLQRDYIDLYLIHWPTKKLSMKWLVEELLRHKQKGSIKAVGLYNFVLEDMKNAIGGAEIDALQSPYSPLAHGLLTGRFTRASKNAERPYRKDRYLFQVPYYEMCMDVLDVLKDISLQHGCTATQAALAWLLNRGGVCAPVIGVSSVEQLLENIAAVHTALSTEDLMRLDTASHPLMEALDLNPVTKKSMISWWPDKDKNV